MAIGGMAATAAAAVLLVSGVFRDSGGTAQATPIQHAVATDRLQGGFAAGDTEGLVRKLAAELRERPGDARTYTLLGLAYQQRARETGNPLYYSKSGGVLARAAKLAPGDPTTTSALGSLALARHRFVEAFRLGRKAVRAAPYTARNTASSETRSSSSDATTKPLGPSTGWPLCIPIFLRTPASHTPASCSAARTRRARALGLALDAAGGQPEPTAWIHVQLGKLAWSHGRADEAEQHYRAALAVFPGYVYALEPLALAEEAKGRHARAIRFASRAAETLPLPQSVATLGDLYARAGKKRAASGQYALVAVIERLLVANGVRTDLETALFDVDHGLRLGRALALARQAQRARPSIDGDDVLAWALARNGRCADALPHSERALRLGTLDALKFFHRGMIERCLGNTVEARGWFDRALRLNPHFSLLWSPVAQR